MHNAIKFTRVGEVTVHASVESETETEVTVRVEVRDTGIGIDPGAQRQAVPPFSQVDASTTRGYGGTGLGLAICSGLIERMGGHIGVESEPGAGSTFWFAVPLAKSSGPRSRRPSPPRIFDGRAGALRRRQRHQPRASCDAPFGCRNGVSHGLGRPNCDRSAARLRRQRPLRTGHPQSKYAANDRARTRPPHPARTAAPRSAPHPDRLGGPNVGENERDGLGISAYATKPIWKKQLLHIVESTLRGPHVAEVSAPSEVPSEEPRAGRGRHILLVEDSPINAEVAGEILRVAGYTFDLATDGLLAIEATLAKPSISS